MRQKNLTVSKPVPILKPLGFLAGTCIFKNVPANFLPFYVSLQTYAHANMHIRTTMEAHARAHRHKNARMLAQTHTHTLCKSCCMEMNN